MDTLAPAFDLPPGGPQDQSAPAALRPTILLDPVETRRTRSLHIINGEHYSGAERVQDLLAAELPAFGCDVHFACLKAGKFPTARAATTAPLEQLGMRGRWDLRAVRQVADVIERDQISLVHAHTPRAALVAGLAAKRTGVPFVYHVHSPTVRDSTQSWRNWTNALVERWSLRHADRLIAVSPSLRDHMIERGFSQQNVIYVPNGVPRSLNATPRSAPQDGWALGMVALFRPRKGLEVLLEALARLRSRGHDIRLRTVGPFESSQYESAIMCLVERLELADTIDWVGFTRDVPSELAKTDLLVLPSLFGEGLPMVVLEALAAGVPVVASDVEGVPEAIVHGETGLLVAPQNVDQLTQAILQLTTGEIDYTAVSRAAIEHHRQRFSAERMASGVADVYAELL